MAKFTRERAIAERRVRKQEKRDEKKQAAALLRDGETADNTVEQSADLQDG